MGRFLAFVTLAAVGALGAGATAAAYPPGELIDVSDSTLVPGEPFTVTVLDCLLGETVEFTLSGQGITDTESATCTGTGGGEARGIAQQAGTSASATFIAPSEPGLYTITAVGLTSGGTWTITVEVVAPAAEATTVPSGALPVTGGSSPDRTLWIGGGALIAGLGLLGVALYRRRPVAG